MTDLPFTLPDLQPGHVWLVGAGPGDPGLLTLLAVRALAQAEVIVHDALVDRRLLTLAGAGAELIDVGKRGGRPSPKQPEISAMLVDLARAGRRVVRLKGGDPFLFGRGAEEAETLAAAKVPFRVVPGVTAGIAGPAYAGIPATARDTNAAVTFITGHDAAGGLPALDWQALARGAPVLVLYMALGQLQAIAERLIAAGRPPAEPVAVIADATTPSQQVLISTLAEAADAIASQGLKPPAIVVIGEAVSLRAKLDWLPRS